MREASRAQRRALLEAAAAAANADEQRRLIEFEVVSTAIEIDNLTRTLALTGRTREARRETLNRVEDRFEVEEATRIDTLRARSQLLETTAEVAELAGDLHQAQTRLASIVSVSSGHPILEAFFNDPHLEAPNRINLESVDVAFLRRLPQVLVEEINYEIRLSELESAEASLFPSLQVSGQISLSSVPTWGFVRNPAVSGH